MSLDDFRTKPRLPQSSSHARAWLGGLAVVVVAPWAYAHHSHAEFADEPIVLEGELATVTWRNPHPAMTLDVVTDGRAETWSIQVLGNINGLRRNGVTGEQFTVGERVAVTGQASRRRPRLLLGTRVTFADGRVAVIGPDESTGQAVYRGRVARGAAARDADGIFRVWVVAERYRNPYLPLRADARAAKAAWDSVTDDPQLGCNPLGMPGAMMSPHPIEFRRRGDDILLELEEWDAERVIHLRRAPALATPSRMGLSRGRWDGRVLIVTTTDIDYPFMDEHGTPQTDAVEVEERFTLSDDERSLEYAATVTDPGTMTEPVVAFTTRWEWVPGETLQPYDCAMLDLPLER